ncbi:MAG: glycoside hydrolase family 3 N-terminal domain-containing protein, partial [Aristaeellaceae bacterium]
MNAVKRLASLTLAALLGMSALPALAEDAPVQPQLQARVKDIIQVDGYQFKDLNDNGELDPYEDWRLSPEERAENLLSLMTAEQKAAQMVHLTLVTRKDSWFSSSNVGFALVYEYIFEPDAEEEDEENAEAATLSSARNAAMRTNEIQELSEGSELGIPVIFSMDTEAGAAFVKDATFLPDEINQGAAGDAELVARLNQVLKEELMAVGVRMALSPDADLITDPRWSRNSTTYTE